MWVPYIPVSVWIVLTGIYVT